jgi:hypothetical protein
MTTLRDTQAPMTKTPGLIFHGVSFDPVKHTVRPFDLTGFDAELQDPDVFSWVDIQAPDIAPMNEVLRRMDIDLVLVSHFDRPEVLPRIAERSDCLAFYLYPIYEPSGTSTPRDDRGDRVRPDDSRPRDGLRDHVSSPKLSTRWSRSRRPASTASSWPGRRPGSSRSCSCNAASTTTPT